MGDPRWTIEDDGEYLSHAGGITGIAPWRVDDDANAHIDDDAFDALVQCVRDADTLRKARDLAAEIDMWDLIDLDEHTVAQADLAALLDLLTTEPQEGTE